MFNFFIRNKYQNDNYIFNKKNGLYFLSYTIMDMSTGYMDTCIGNNISIDVDVPSHIIIKLQ